MYLGEADEKSTEIFSTALGQVLGPIVKPRYVIPRFIDIAKHNMLSRILPEFVGKYFVKYERSMAMLHTVPDILAGHKDNVAVFEKHWNQYVSPGEAMYAHREDSRELIRQAKQNAQVPRSEVRTKEVFLTSAAETKSPGPEATGSAPLERPVPVTHKTPEPAPTQTVRDGQQDVPSATRRAVNSPRVHRASDSEGSRARRADD